MDPCYRLYNSSRLRLAHSVTQPAATKVLRRRPLSILAIFGSSIAYLVTVHISIISDEEVVRSRQTKARKELICQFRHLRFRGVLQSTDPPRVPAKLMVVLVRTVIILLTISIMANPRIPSIAVRSTLKTDHLLLFEPLRTSIGM